MLNVRERLNEFYNTEMYSKYRETWTDKACKVIADAYALGINVEWVKAKLESCDRISIHQTIILKAKDKLDFWQVEEDEKEIVKSILAENQKELYNLLTEIIYNYCIR